jgi:uncharacterized protein (TIGR03435 family)
MRAAIYTVSVSQFLLFLGVAAISLAAQPATFEVASVRPAATPDRRPMLCLVPCTPGERLTVEGRRVEIRYMSLQKLIAMAYHIKFYQLSGPDWMSSQRFDIMAKMPDGVSPELLPDMVQALLAERFKLAIHRDTKEQSVYALVVGKNGPKLQPSSAEADAPPPESKGSLDLAGTEGYVQRLENGSFVVTGAEYGPARGGFGPGGLKVEFLRLTMPALTDMLAPHVERPVVDMTNLKGGYYFSWENRAPEGGGRKQAGPRTGVDGAGPPDDPMRDTLFTAIDKVGLKLESRKAPVEMIVVDHLEKTPTEN